MSNSRGYILEPNSISVLNNKQIGITAQNIHCVFPPKAYMDQFRCPAPSATYSNITIGF